ncbi:MAG: DUF4145 domain-containing protein [Proteobacteria bacterium]|nr:DUF4145 domain-containing protein [Pseudomonadota bacterium]
MSVQIDSLDSLVKILIERCNSGLNNDQSFSGLLHCALCKNIQRHSFKQSIGSWQSIHKNQLDFSKSISLAKLNGQKSKSISDFIIETFIDVGLRGNCLNCNARVVMLIHRSQRGHSLLTLYEHGGGPGTSNTPEVVKYYLDQAFCSANIGAHSAAVIMHRSAIDALLADNGYNKGTCGNKITMLENDIKKGTAPKWALNLDTELFKTIRNLGNDAGHPNPINFPKQLEYDAKLYSATSALFRHLLDEIYEAPIRRKALHDEIKKYES